MGHLHNPIGTKVHRYISMLPRYFSLLYLMVSSPSPLPRHISLPKIRRPLLVKQSLLAVESQHACRPSTRARGGSSGTSSGRQAPGSASSMTGLERLRQPCPPTSSPITGELPSPCIPRRLTSSGAMRGWGGPWTRRQGRAWRWTGDHAAWLLLFFLQDLSRSRSVEGYVLIAADFLGMFLSSQSRFSTWTRIVCL